MFRMYVVPHFVGLVLFTASWSSANPKNVTDLAHICQDTLVDMIVHLRAREHAGQLTASELIGLRRELNELARRFSIDAQGSLPTPSKNEIPDLPVTALVLGPRAKKGLARLEGVEKIGDLERITREDLLSVGNVGEASVAEIERELSRFGVKMLPSSFEGLNQLPRETRLLKPLSVLKLQRKTLRPLESRCESLGGLIRLPIIYLRSIGLSRLEISKVRSSLKKIGLELAPGFDQLTGSQKEELLISAIGLSEASLRILRERRIWKIRELRSELFNERLPNNVLVELAEVLKSLGLPLEAFIAAEDRDRLSLK